MEILNIQKKQISLCDTDTPDGFNEKYDKLKKIFEEIINLVRNDLHMDNTYIHDFINKYQKLKK